MSTESSTEFLLKKINDIEDKLSDYQILFEQNKQEITFLKERVDYLEKENKQLITLPNLHEVLNKNNNHLYFSRLTGSNVDCSKLISWSNLTILEIFLSRTNGCIDFFRGLTNLEKLSLHEITVKDISVVRNCTKLQKIFLSIDRHSMESLKGNIDVNWLGELILLKELEIGIFGLKNVDFVKNLKLLRNFIFNDPLLSYEGLANHESLQMLMMNEQGKNNKLLIELFKVSPPKNLDIEFSRINFCWNPLTYGK